MSFCTFNNGILSFTSYSGQFGQFYLRFRGNTLRSVEIFKRAEGDPNFLPSKKWTSCPPEEGFIHIDNAIWGFCRIGQGMVDIEYQIIPKHENVLCNGVPVATQLFANPVQNYLVELEHITLSSWELHDGQGNYVDVIVVLEDNGGGGGCYL